MKKLSNIMLILLAFFTTLIVVFCLLYNFFIGSVDKNNDKSIKVEIASGSGVDGITKILKEKELIKNELVFKIYLKFNSSPSLKAGNYNLNKSMDVKKIVNILNEGSTYNPDEVIITFKEGINMRGIANIISKNTNNTDDEVFSLLEDKEYISSLINEYWFLTDTISNANIYYPLEGYLFPNTYNFKNKDVKIKDIFKVMLDETNDILKKYEGDIKNSKYSVHELLSLASMIELEGISKPDRINISSVFYNRLDSNMSLGSDVTTYYAHKINMGDKDLNSSELNINNLYNTRGPNMAGKLPIGPICNPSKDSIEAAIKPSKTDYYYFVADNKMKVYFTKNIKEHNNIINKLKKENLWNRY